MKQVKLLLGMVAVMGCTMASQSLHAQRGESKMDVGSVTFNIGVGAGRSGYGNYGYYGGGIGYGTGFGIKAALERGMWQLGPGVLSLGVELGGSFSGTKGYHSSIVIAAVRSAYHFGWNVPNLDTYGGLSLGPGLRSYDYYYDQNTINKRHDATVAPGIFAGASYYFSPNIGVNAEVGYDITVIQGGLIFKIK